MIRALFFICATLISFAGGTAVQPNSATEDDRPVITGEQLVRLAVFTPHAQYPRAALERNITGSGSFILHIRVQTGLVRYVEIEHSTGSELLDSAAVSSLKTWRFKPGMLPTIANMNLHSAQPYPTEDSVVRVPFSFTIAADAPKARIKVALLDGAPVYHWRVFSSSYADDIDRALVLREFKRQGFTLPDHFITEAVQREITEKYQGSKTSLEQDLRRSGVSLQDYREFVAEEIILKALPMNVARHSKWTDSPATRAKWIASLRAGANIKSLR
jgi:TonB family protein